MKGTTEIDSFEQARALDRDALYGLLESDRPEQRVWAVWAIALSLGERAGDFAQRVESEPNPGVRRALAVILASHGEYDFLVELALHDPALVVRESVTQMITRLAAGTGNARLRAVVDEAATGVPSIRIALLGAITRGAPDFLVAIAQRQLDSKERDVQEEAFETLLRLDLPATFERAKLWFRSQPEPWRYTDRWLRGADLRSLAETVADLPMMIRGRVLEQLRAPPWSDVEILIGGDRELLRSLLSRSDIAIPARVLAKTVCSGAHEGFATRLADQLAMAARGRALLGSLRVAIDTDGDGSSVRGLGQHVRRYADALEIPDRDVVLAELGSTDWPEHLLGLENAVTRWLAGHDAPADLMATLPDLLKYCRRHLAKLVRTGAGTQRPRRRAGELVVAGSEPRTEQEVFGELVVALDRLAER